MALPMSRAELLADLRSAAPSDFARGLGQLHGEARQERLAAEYEVHLQAARQTMGLARAEGVTVVTRATLADLEALTGRFEVVSVIAHAPSRGVTTDDIVDAGAICRTIALGDSDDHDRLRRRLAAARISLDAPPPSPRALAEVLQRSLWTLDVLAERSPEQLDRTRLEDALPEGLRPAPVIELADGLHGIAALRGAISPRFGGVLDLSTCVSVVVAEALKRTRSDFLVLGTTRPTVPLHRFLLYRIRLAELVRAGRPVLFRELHRFVAEALGHAASR
ncbi:MAG: hypothetical protein U0441_05675 [Polyangiaceae bacterium]